MLKPIVQQKHVGMEHMFEHLAGLPAVRADSDVRNSGTNEDLGFIAALERRHAPARRNHEHLLDRFPAIPTSKDGRLQPLSMEFFSQPLHKRRLAGSAHADSANANNGSGEPANVCTFMSLVSPHKKDPHFREKPQKGLRRPWLVPNRHSPIMSFDDFSSSFRSSPPALISHFCSPRTKVLSQIPVREQFFDGARQFPGQID